MDMIYNIGDGKMSKSEVGNKAFMLDFLKQKQFNIMDGFVISKKYFDKWIIVLRNNNDFIKLINNNLDYNAENFNFELNKYIGDLIWDNDMEKSISGFLERFQRDQMFIVRSSSNYEDGLKKSFAGMYESVLNVNRNTIVKAIKYCFMSSFSQNVINYKKDGGFELFDSDISIIVQKQLDAEKTGIVFTLNPYNNDQDSIVINLCMGKLDKLVSGKISTETYEINKLLPIYSDNNICTKYEMTRIVFQAMQIEKELNYFIDIEFAIKDNDIVIFQVRPIATYYSLSNEMKTDILEDKRLYLDIE